MRTTVEFAGLVVLSTSLLLAARVLAEALPHLEAGRVVTSAAQGLAAAALAALWFFSTSRDARASAAATALMACLLAFGPSSTSGSTLAAVAASISAGLLLVVAAIQLRASSSDQGHRRDGVRPAAVLPWPSTAAETPVAVAVDRPDAVASGASVTRPVFVDLSGRRRVLTRWCGRALAAACVAYMALACAGVSAVHVGPMIPVAVPVHRLPEPERLRGTPGVLEQASVGNEPSRTRQADESTRPATTGTTR